MALLALALFIVVVSSFIGAALSSRARSEKKSIASFHQHMGQLSDVVKSESHLDDSGLEVSPDLFTSAPSHVRVVGKTNGSKSSSASKRRTYRPNSVNGSTAKSGRPATRDSLHPQIQIQHDFSDLTASQIETSLNDIESQAADGVGMASAARPLPVPRRTRLSSSSRSSGSKVPVKVIRFDDAASDGADEDSTGGSGSFRVDRHLNTKVLAAGSVAVLVGLGAIFVALNSSHQNVSGNGPIVNTATKSVGKPKITTTTTVPAPAGPLAPTSANSTGAIYFVNSPSITIGISASAPAWVEESVAPGSKILWQGIIPAGGSKTLTLNSSMWIRTGNVGVLTMTANGQPISFSAAPGVYEFTFRQGVKA